VVREAVGAALGEAMETAVRQAVGSCSSRQSNSGQPQAAEGLAVNAAARLAIRSSSSSRSRKQNLQGKVTEIATDIVTNLAE
jgi:hypothetical protein